MDTNTSINANTINNGRGAVVDFILITAIFAVYSVTAVLGYFSSFGLTAWLFHKTSLFSKPQMTVLKNLPK